MFSTMDSDVQLTSSAGTPAFMAPECLDRESISLYVLLNLVIIRSGKSLCFHTTSYCVHK